MNWVNAEILLNDLEEIEQDVFRNCMVNWMPFEGYDARFHRFIHVEKACFRLHTVIARIQDILLCCFADWEYLDDGTRSIELTMDRRDALCLSKLSLLFKYSLLHLLSLSNSEEFQLQVLSSYNHSHFQCALKTKMMQIIQTTVRYSFKNVYRRVATTHSRLKSVDNSCLFLTAAVLNWVATERYTGVDTPEALCARLAT